MFAYTNKDVDALNASLREVRRQRRRVSARTCGSPPSTAPADFAVGDRVQFTDTLRAVKIYNGNAGTITGIDATTGVVRGAAGQRRWAWVGR